MFNRFIGFLLVALIFFGSCSNNQVSKTDIVANYFSARNSFDFTLIKTFLADSVTQVEGTLIMPYSINDYYTIFQWDSVFSPEYVLTDIRELNNQVIVTLSVSSGRFEFLDNNPFVIKQKVSFSGNRIREIEMAEYIGADFEIWEKKRQLLIDWVDENHPELTGFIFDMTKTGAENYVKAIKMYQTELME